MSAQQHLAQFGITVEQAKDFIIASIFQPESLFNTFIAYGVTAEMVAEIYGGISANDVVAFFNAIGLDGTALHAEDSVIDTPVDDSPVDETPAEDPQDNVASLPDLTDDGALKFSFVMGSSSEDVLRAGSATIPSVDVALGMEGNDQLTGNGSTGAILLGGMGNDSYTLEYHGYYVVQDEGGDNDSLYIPSTYERMQAALLNDGQDLILYDSSVSVLLPKWQSEAHRIEQFSLSGVDYDMGDLELAVSIYGKPVSASDLADFNLNSGDVDQHLALFDYLSEVTASGVEQQLPFDTAQTAGSDALIDLLL